MNEYYRIFDQSWNPYSEQGYRHYMRSLEIMKYIVKHQFIKELLDIRKEIRILDLCGGCGIGGMTLATTILKKRPDRHVSVTVVDIRKEALNIAKKWAKEETGIDIETIALNALEVHKLKKKYNIVLLYGNSISHFNPWDALILFSTLSDVVTNRGIVIIENVDVGSLLLLGYKHIWTDKGPVISIHTNYDLLRGVCNRLCMSVGEDRKGAVSLHFWYTASLGALLYCFFKELNIMMHPWELWTSYIFARNPRNVRAQKRDIANILRDYSKLCRQ